MSGKRNYFSTYFGWWLSDSSREHMSSEQRALSTMWSVFSLLLEVEQNLSVQWTNISLLKIIIQDCAFYAEQGLLFITSRMFWAKCWSSLKCFQLKIARLARCKIFYFFFRLFSVTCGEVPYHLHTNYKFWFHGSLCFSIHENNFRNITTVKIHNCKPICNPGLV